jgi:microcompartment protein CcmL/EutN
VAAHIIARVHNEVEDLLPKAPVVQLYEETQRALRTSRRRIT